LDRPPAPIIQIPRGKIVSFGPEREVRGGGSQNRAFIPVKEDEDEE
jgi:hypothetical protein